MWENDDYLVGGLDPWNFMTFHILGIIIPTDELIFFRGVETTNQLYIRIIELYLIIDNLWTRIRI